MKKILALVLVVCSVFAFGACQKKEEGSTLKYAEDQGKFEGKMIVGLDDTFAPMGFRTEAGELIGFDIDLAKAVAEQMGIAVEFKPIVWDAKEMELNEKKIDVIWNGMSKTPEREANMNLSKPYFNNSIVIMTLADKPIASKADLVGKNIGTQAASAALEMIQADAIYGDIADRVAEYDDYDAAVMDLDTGRLDAVIIDKVAGMYKNTQTGGKYAFCEEDFGEDFYVIGMRKGEDDFTEKLNAALDAVIASGKAAEISQKWFGEDLVLR